MLGGSDAGRGKFLKKTKMRVLDITESVNIMREQEEAKRKKGKPPSVPFRLIWL